MVIDMSRKTSNKAKQNLAKMKANLDKQQVFQANLLEQQLAPYRARQRMYQRYIARNGVLHKNL